MNKGSKSSFCLSVGYNCNMNFKEKTKEFVLKVSTEKSFRDLETYVQMIEDKNKVMNLTGFSGDRLWEEGIYESIVSLYQVFNNPGSKKLLDIGAGAGFPSVPFKIVFPELKLSIIEPQNKRVLFLDSVSNELSLDIDLIVKRAEDVNDLEFDLITARAVAPLYALLEISSHLGKKGAHFAFLKGPSLVEEIKFANKMISKFGIKGNMNKISDSSLSREAFVYEYVKQVDTPEGYPRPWAKIVAENK